MNEKVRWHHTHPITILFSLKRFLFLLIIPAVRGIYSSLQTNGYMVWKNGTRYDIMVLIAMFLGSMISWLAEGYRIESDFLFLKSGIFRKKITQIPLDALSTMVTYQVFYLRPLMASYCEFYTGGGLNPEEENGVYLTKRQAKEIRDIWSAHQPPTEVKDFTSEIGWKKTLVLAIALNNYVGGFVLLITFLQNARQFASNRISAMAEESFSFVVSFLERYLPATLTTLIIILIAGLVVGFFQQFFRYMNLGVRRQGRLLKIRNGFLSKQHNILYTGKINYVLGKQGVFLSLLEWQLTLVNCIGYKNGTQKGEPVLLAVEKEAKGWEKTSRILPEYTKAPITLNSDHPRALFSFFWQPLLGMVATIIGTFLLEALFPNWTRFIAVIGLIVLIPFVWMAIIKWFDFGRGGAGVSEDAYTINTSSAFAVETVLLPKDRMAHISYRQNPLQKRYDLATIYIYPFSRGNKVEKKFILRQIPLEEARAFFSE